MVNSRVNNVNNAIAITLPSGTRKGYLFLSMFLRSTHSAMGMGRYAITWNKLSTLASSLQLRNNTKNKGASKVLAMRDRREIP